MIVDRIETANHFGAIDYVVFGLMLMISTIVGVYYGYFRKGKGKLLPANKDEKEEIQTTEYLMASRNLSPIPVAMSLISSYVSGVTVLGTPTEVYNFGTQYWLIFISIWLMGVAVIFIYLPVFLGLNIKSAYEYLEIRYSSRIRTFVSCLFILEQILFLPMVVYVPSLAFTQVTGVNIYLVAAIVSTICIFYTTVGGLKAVVWTDTWQTIVMLLSEVIIVILGTYSLGGFDVIWDRGIQGDRIKFFNVNPSLYERQSFWGVIIGGFFFWTSHNCANQTMVQRYLSLPNLRFAQFSAGLYTIGVSFFVWSCCYSGLLVYATYWKCDPLSTGHIQADDQLLPLFIMEKLGNLKGVPGLFIASVFGAGLSSMSVVLNSSATVLLEDVLKGHFHIYLKDKHATLFVKVVTVLFGLWTFVSIMIAEKLGGVLGVVTALTAIGSSTTCGIFTLGMLVPFSNTKGAMVGGLAAMLFAGTISIGSQVATATGALVLEKLPVSVEECLANATIIATSLNTAQNDSVFPLFRLSYHWISPAAILTVLVVGSITSWFTRSKNDSYPKKEYLSPVIHRFLNYDDLPIGPPENPLLDNDR